MKVGGWKEERGRKGEGGWARKVKEGTKESMARRKRVCKIEIWNRECMERTRCWKGRGYKREEPERRRRRERGKESRRVGLERR